jgi:hypothetical protein
LSSTLGITSAASHFAVINPSGGGADTLFDNRDSSVDGYRIATSSTTKINFDWLNSDVEIDRVSGQAVYYFNKTSSQTQSGANGGTLVTASESGSVSVTTAPRIGARSFSSALNFFAGTINEFIVYNSDQTDNRTAIEANIGEAYSIDLPSGVDPGFDQVDGFVETWYDQSGNGNNALQDTASLQPQIVNAGSLVTGGLDFDGTDDFLELESIVGATNSQSIFGVVKLDALDGSTQMILDNRDGNGDGSAYFAGSNEFRYLFDSNSPIAQLSASTDQSLVSAFKTSSNVAIGIDGGTLDTASNTETISVATAPRIGSRSFSSASAFLGGEIAELIIYNADESSNRTALETNINSHYSIF